MADVMSDNLNGRIINATKWSTLTALIAKLINPVISMILARVLTPEAFGIVATLAMVTSFAGLFTDAGFHNYIVQHDFNDEKALMKSADVAFWSNLMISIVIWGGIVIFAEQLATLVGSPGYGFVLIVASSSILLGAFTSIQSALYKRRMDFKTLFKVRSVSIFIPLIITVPLAFWLRSYWALVWGGLAQGLTNTILLSVYSSWIPRLFFSLRLLKEMLSFTIWTLFESFSIWLTNYIDIFIVGSVLSQYYLGLYKTSTAIVVGIMSLITAATTPVLFASLSRLQDNEDEFKRLFFRFQKLVGLLVIPISVIIFSYDDLITKILLGDQWIEASGFIGLWGLTTGITIVLSHYASEIYRAKGRPKLSVLAQWLHIIVMCPVVLCTVRDGFHILYLARSVVRLELVLVNIIIIYKLVHFSPCEMFKNITPAILSSIPIFLIACGMKWIDNSSLSQIGAIVVSSFVYVAVIYLFPSEHLFINTFILKRKKGLCPYHQ